MSTRGRNIFISDTHCQNTNLTIRGMLGESTYSAHKWRTISGPVLKTDETVITIVSNI